MTAIFLLSALALPVHPQSDFYLLKWYLEKIKPEYLIVYVNPDERLLYPKAECTPLMVGDPPLRVWAVRKSA